VIPITYYLTVAALLASDPRLSVVVSHPTHALDTSSLSGVIESVCALEGHAILLLNVVLTDHTAVRELNVSYLSHDFDTDVLAFPLGDAGTSEIDGEIYVDLDTARERCAEFGATFEDEVTRYVIHGLLHLMGYTDKTATGARLMREKEERYLQESTNK
jgi:rRNA maturation RNase YbeY